MEWKINTVRTTLVTAQYTVTWRECPAGLRLNRNVSLNEGSLSCLQTLVFFLITFFWVEMLITYIFTYKSENKNSVCKMAITQTIFYEGNIIVHWELSHMLNKASRPCSICFRQCKVTKRHTNFLSNLNVFSCCMVNTIPLVYVLRKII